MERARFRHRSAPGGMAFRMDAGKPRGPLMFYLLYRMRCTKRRGVLFRRACVVEGCVSCPKT
eukprot:8089607-Pyramimonas_sp.AAC.1